MSRRSITFGVCAAMVLGLLGLLGTACGGDRSTVKVVIPDKATMHVVADSLATAGIVGSTRLFRIYAAIRQGDRRVKAGTYLLRRGTNWNAALDAVLDGKNIVHIVTIPEGFSVEQIARLLESRLGVPVESLQVAVRDTALLSQLDVPSPTIEGYLFPDTYDFPDGTTAREAVRLMVHRFEQVWRPEWSARADSIPMSRHDVLTLASIVETEAKLSEERPVIAAVYMNRLRAGMKLQADPTVEYALGAHQPRLFYKQLAVNSPYNTYIHKGLPPGPIASPGSASILAALYPANVPYKYFVALPDGHHEFHIDLAGHDKAVARARRAWDSLDLHARGTGARHDTAPGTAKVPTGSSRGR